MDAFGWMQGDGEGGRPRRRLWFEREIFIVGLADSSEFGDIIDAADECLRRMLKQFWALNFALSDSCQAVVYLTRCADQLGRFQNECISFATFTGEANLHIHRVVHLICPDSMAISIS